ncbi:hypothetical protein Y032_0109g111 [Ancylostoma ceylanicum]|uniref:BZIP domain-containing protein n=1 Tax=Ancylostoma ceylanicum TaxID=53326 RepID=A0A016TE19_9BILA|nr:hypothetical protein Y032_0109g111 [Ancylostoma ceylanicum]
MSLYYAAMSSLHYAASVSGRTIIFRLLRNTTRVERRLRPNTPSAGAGRMPTYSPGCRYLPIDDRTPSPPTSDRSSPANGLLVGGVVYDGCNGSSSFSSHAGVVNGLAVAQQQLKSRSKMHEMAVRQRLITDQDPRSQGLVQLSAEEKRTLVQEGYPVPTRLPLSKAEEESLKIVRRKIKNKLSAQESRRKRKEYMDTLESRCQAYFNENTQLKNRVRQLEMSNQKLVMQVKKLQDMVATTPSHSDVAANH